MSREPELYWETDVTPAAWLTAALAPWANHVASLVPGGFAAIARVLHPAGDEARADAPRQRWADLARANGRLAHRTMQFHNIARPRGTPSADPHDVPGLGALPLRERALLVQLLTTATTTPDRCWFCVWEGWGTVDDQGVATRVDLPHRRYLLHRGPISDALAVPPQTPDGVAVTTVAAPGEPPPAPLTRQQIVRWLERSWRFGPAIWWPQDRAWVVVTDIDFGCTYVASSHQTIQHILAHPDLEAFPAKSTDPFTDPLNAALDAPDGRVSA